MANELAESGAKARVGKSTPPLVLAALGIVFGDIGTSPLYAFQTVFAAPHGIQPDPTRVFGALSLIFWTITLIVGVKYVLIVMRADNDGEGGIMALTALTMMTKMKNNRRKILLVGLGVLGAALFYGDAMITPAISVLSAVEGLEIAAPALQPLVIPIVLVVLTALFWVQRLGTHWIGKFFGPIMLVWFVVIAAAGVASIVQTPRILEAISPTWAFELFVQEPLIAFLALGAVILCVTGAEALYADMGHFGTGPIRISWFGLVTLALYANYLGQGALVIRHPEQVTNPFYNLFPSVVQLPVVILAMLATVIASQAVISGAFSLTEQAMKLRFLPRMTVKHTSASAIGQVYVPFMNWAIFVVVIGLVLGFQDSSNLAAAYGLAVSGTFVITTVLISVLARRRWQVPLWILIPATTFFLVIDLAFFAANLTKLPHGGWLPVVIAIGIFFVFTTWSKGRYLLRKRTAKLTMSPQDIAEALDQSDVVRPPGTRVFLSPNEQVSLAFTTNLRRFSSVAENTILLGAITAKVPVVPDQDRLKIEHVARGVRKVEVHYGFMEHMWSASAIQKAKSKGLDLTGDVTFVVHSIRIEPKKGKGMAKWRKHVFSFMLQNSRDPAKYFRLPNDQVVEFTSVVDL